MPLEYVPSPHGGGDLDSYLQQELGLIAQILSIIADGLIDVRNVAPEKPRNGIYYADGTDWNPGSGRGIYRYDESTETYSFLG